MPSRRLTDLSMVAVVVCGLALWTRASGAEDSVLVTFDLASDPHFVNYKGVVESFARSKKIHGPAEFCVVGYLAGDTKLAWVIWQKGHQIILWDGGHAPLALSRRTIDLRKDVVKTQSEVGTSTYLMTQSWIDSLVSACNQFGKVVRLR